MNLIAIMTCHRFRARINVLRRTWIPDVLPDTDVRFFFGGSDGVGERGADEVWLTDCPDDYRNLRTKVQRALAWAVDAGYDHVLKVDDDTFVIPERLCAGHDYAGRVRAASHEATAARIYGSAEVPFCSGFGYWLSRRAAGIVAEAPDNGDWAEDRFAANVLARAGIRPVHEPTFMLWPGVYVHSPCRTDGRCTECATCYDNVAVVCPHERGDVIAPMHAHFKVTGRIITSWEEHGPRGGQTVRLR